MICTKCGKALTPNENQRRMTFTITINGLILSDWAEKLEDELRSFFNERGFWDGEIHDSLTGNSTSLDPPEPSDDDSLNPCTDCGGFGDIGPDRCICSIRHLEGVEDY